MGMGPFDSMKIAINTIGLPKVIKYNIEQCMKPSTHSIITTKSQSYRLTLILNHTERLGDYV
jgi:hypothetical protein